jgi:hypothetical protein
MNPSLLTIRSISVALEVELSELVK